MRKLLSAGFARLKSSRIFWICMALMFGVAVFIILNQYYSYMENGITTRLDNLILGFAIIIPVIAAVFCTLFLGTEYSDGTIRNKLIIGHGRAAIYLSSLIISIIASLMMCLAFLVGICALGIPLLGGLRTALPQFLAMLGGSVLMVCAVCAILTAVCMLISNKTIIAIVSILGMILLLLLAIDVNAKLNEPEFYPSTTYISIDGTPQQSEEPMPNPNFLTGTKRAVYEYVYDILPTGQALQYSSMSAAHLWQMPLYSFAIIIVSTWIGLFFFRRKDLK